MKRKMYADGRKRQLTIEKGEVESPTIATKPVLITTAISAYENREVEVVTLPIYPFAEMDVIVHKVFHGELAEWMTQSVPQIYKSSSLMGSTMSQLFM